MASRDMVTYKKYVSTLAILLVGLLGGGGEEGKGRRDYGERVNGMSADIDDISIKNQCRASL